VPGDEVTEPSNPRIGLGHESGVYRIAGSRDPDAGDTRGYAWDLDGAGQYDESTALAPSYTCTSQASTPRLCGSPTAKGSWASGPA
jgi:hypothetical protein